MEKITKFDLDAAFKALDEIESPVIEKSEKAKRLVEEVRRVPTVDALVEEYYDINNQADLEDAKEERDEEIAKAKLAKIEKIVDLDAESPEDLEPSYEGKTIIQCPQCMTMFYKDPADVVISEDDPSLCNVGEKCQHCGNDDGYAIIGKVAPVEPEEAEKFEGSEEENELNLDFEDKDVETAKTPADEEVPELASAEETENSEEAKESFTSKVADALLEDFDEEDSEESGVEESVNNSDIQKEAEANSELATENESENKTINEGLSDKELDKKLRDHNNFIEYVRAQIKQDEEALKKAGDNEEIKAAIQRRLDAHKEDLEKALPAAIKVEKAIEELPTPEEIKNESVNNKESLKEYFDDPDYWSDKMGPSYLISYNGKPVCYIEYPYAGELGYGGEEPSDEEILFRAKEVLNNSIDREKLDLADNATELDDSKISYEYEDDVDYVDVPTIKVAYGFKEGLKEDASLGTLESLNKSEVQKDAAKHSKLETENHSKNLTLNESSVEAELNKFMAGLEEACKDCEESGVELNESPVEEKKLDEFEAEVNATTAADESLKEAASQTTELSNYNIWLDEDGTYKNKIEKKNISIEQAYKEIIEYINKLSSEDKAKVGLVWYEIDADEEEGDIIVAVYSPSENIEERTAANYENYESGIKKALGLDESLKEELPSDVTAAANEVINKLDALNDKAEAEIKEESGVEEGLEEATKEEPKFDFELPKATNAEFKKMINSKTFKEFGEEINGPEASFDLLEEVDEKSFNENITKFLTAVYENVDTFETKGCSLKENKLIVEGKINFKSGNTNETVFEFVVAKSPKAFPILEGYNKTFAEGKIFTVDCIGEDGGKRLLVDHISYKYNIGENLIEGLTK